METAVNIADLLNGLIGINNNRIICYEKAAQWSQLFAPSLKNHFHKLAMQVKLDIQELGTEVLRLGTKTTKKMTLSGRMYNIWNDLKASVTGHDDRSLRNSCRHSDTVALQCYNECLTNPLLLYHPIRKLVERQFQILRDRQNNFTTDP